jgi:hypothetical protein
MDDDKDNGIIEKTIESVEEFASEVKDAAKHMMDPPEPLKPGDEVVMMPTALRNVQPLQRRNLW